MQKNISFRNEETREMAKLVPKAFEELDIYKHEKRKQ